MTTLRNDDVSKTLRRLDELNMHRPDRSDVLIDDRIERPPAFGDVTAEAANKAQIVRRIDKDLDIHLLEQTRFRKNQDAFDDDNRFRLNPRRRRQTGMRLEIIDRQFDRLAGV